MTCPKKAALLFWRTSQEKGFISYYTCSSIPKLFSLTGLVPVKRRRVGRTFLLLRISPIQLDGCKEETSDAWCYRLWAQIWERMSVTGQSFWSLSVRFTGINSLQFASIHWRSFLPLCILKCCKGIHQSYKPQKVLRTLWKNTERKELSADQKMLKRLVFLK